MTLRGQSQFCMVLFLVFVFAFNGVSLHGATFICLGFLPDSDHRSTPYGVSADGTVVVGQAHSSGHNNVPYRWTAEDGVISLSSLEGEGRAVSADGNFIVGHENYLAYRWSSEGGFEYLGDLPGGDEFSMAWDVSTDGSVVVGVGSSQFSNSIIYPTSYEAFRWTESGGMVGLGYLEEEHYMSWSRACSADGSIIVGQLFNEQESMAFQWSQNQGMVELLGLDGLPGSYSSALDVSSDGTIIVGFLLNEGVGQACMWVDGEAVRLGTSSIHHSMATAISGDGSIIVGEDNNRPFIWDEVNGMRDLTEVIESEYGIALNGFRLEYVNDISADGTVIVGSGGDNNEGWMFIIPEPCSVLLLAFGALLTRRTRSI